jgi:hypothetical protein
MPTATRYPQFDRSGVALGRLVERGHDLLASACLSLVAPTAHEHQDRIHFLVEQIRSARRLNRPVIVTIGGHPIKQGLSRFLIDLIERGWITHIATNGAGISRTITRRFAWLVRQGDSALNVSTSRARELT